MRRRKELMQKLKVKVLEDRRNGLTYAQIERKRGVSSRTIADLIAGKDPQRFCEQCGETDPGKLEQHHPDRVNQPDATVTLCASCHAEVTREQQRQRNKLRKEKSYTPEILSLSKIVPFETPPAPQMVSRPAMRPLTPQEKRLMGKVSLYSGGGVALGEAVFDHRIPWWGRLLIAGLGIGLLYGGGKL